MLGSNDEWPPVDASVERAVVAQLHKSTSIYDRSGVILELERKFEALTGMEHVLLTSSGTAALHSAYYALGLGPGDEVLVPAYTFFATAMPLFQLGALPVLVDCDARCNLSLLEAELLLTENTKALVITHMWGNPAPSELYRQFCDEHGIALVEDCSHAHGATYKLRSVGALADVAVFSLQAAKLVPAGEGGVLCTNRSEIYQRAVLLGHFNKRAKQDVARTSELYKYVETGLGLKYRIHALGAAMANVLIDRLPAWLMNKQRNARLMQSLLEECFVLHPIFAAVQSSSPAYYALALMLEEGCGLSRERVLELAWECDLPGVDVPGSTRSLSTFAIFAVPVSPVTKYDSSCIRRPVPVAERISSLAVKIDVPWTPTEQLQSYFESFQLWVSALNASASRKVDSPSSPRAEVSILTRESILIEEKQATEDGIGELVVGAVAWRMRHHRPEVLLLSRIDEGFMGGIEELPGGGVESGEEILHALLRELKEETGLTATKIETYLGSFDYDNEWSQRARQLNFSVHLAGEKVAIEPQEHKSHRWVDAEDLLRNSRCTPEVMQVVAQWIKLFAAGQIS